MNLENLSKKGVIHYAAHVEVFEYWNRCYMHPTNKRRSRRLRKKLRIGEFKELGFKFAAKIKPSITLDMEDSLVSAFLSEIVDPRSLTFGGGISDGFITCFGRGSVTEADRELILSWLVARPEIETARIGPLVEAWHPRSLPRLSVG